MPYLVKGVNDGYEELEMNQLGRKEGLQVVALEDAAVAVEYSVVTVEDVPVTLEDSALIFDDIPLTVDAEVTVSSLESGVEDFVSSVEEPRDDST